MPSPVRMIVTAMKEGLNVETGFLDLIHRVKSVLNSGNADRG